MLSAFIRSRLSYGAIHLAAEPLDQRSVQLGPLVLELNPLKNRTPAADRRPTCLTHDINRLLGAWTITSSSYF
jgi:hypothetical protein